MKNCSKKSLKKFNKQFFANLVARRLCPEIEIEICFLPLSVSPVQLLLMLRRRRNRGASSQSVVLLENFPEQNPVFPVDPFLLLPFVCG
jgi:hypothetical protein